jgi:hypothetical protein
VILIGMVGAKRSGKDSVANALINFDPGMKRHSFADKIRDVLYEINPLVDDNNPGLRLPTNYRVNDLVDRFGWETAKQYPEVRRLLQELGTRMRSVDENVWVAPVHSSILFSSNPHHIVTDVRFPNEVEMIKRLGGIIVRVTRTGLVNDDKHASEQLYRTIEPDVELINDGDLESLEAKALVLLASQAHYAPEEECLDVAEARRQP